MATITIRVSDEEKRLIEMYAAQEKRSVSDVIRLATIENIEDAYDYQCAVEAWEEYLADPVTYTMDEIIAKHGIIV